MNHRSITYNLFFAAAIAGVILVPGCKKPYDYDKEVAAPIATPEKIAASLTGNWEMKMAMQVDEKSLTKESIDISDFLLSEGKSPNISFHADGSFTVDTPGLIINYFVADQGLWTFDDPRYPTKILLKDAANNALTEISIGSNLVGLSPQLSYISAVDCSGEKAMSYNITLIKK
jgi:hypothetical protein